ncbi:ThuA domain-containing protein [Micromonospora sp. SL4-19]|uniref:ThuA domain-containing protein n=1 Tax=Micromonospora sp. SL4-19 TaxID=3399129 RepID=UPI003A4D48CE
MARSWRRLQAAVLATVLAVPTSWAALAGPAAAAGPSTATAEPAFRALVFSKTAGFRHSSIPNGIAAIQKLGQENNFAVDSTEDSAQFTDENLARYDVVVWLSTTGDVLNADQQAAFERYVQAGGGYAGVHAAADTEYDWAWYGNLVGAYFNSHPAEQNATVKVEDPAHPSTKQLPQRWTRYDEWYNYRTNPRGKVHVLTSMDEQSYSPGAGAMGAEHPITWCQDYDGGRSWYTGLGHTEASYTEAEFLKLLLGGLQTAAGTVKADCSATLTSSFEKITLDDNTSNPMSLNVANDGRVFYIDRLGDMKVIKPDTRQTVQSGHLNVYTGNESGLLGLALDPKFDENNWVYLFYSPSGANVDRLSRFTMSGDALDLTTEKNILDVPVQRAECCHHGGDLVFDGAGNLIISTGDNTNPFASDGYAPIDERAGRSSWDAQRTSGNTNDLRGKILRIRPQTDGTYTIPAGNLFAAGTDKTKPEIYAMGFRNPFRIDVDPATGRVLVADYGPDAGTANPDRGPENTVEWNVLKQAGNYGWPYCIGNNKPYKDYDFATGVSGPAFDCTAPVNSSPNNTGLTNLPAAIAADVYYHYAGDPAFPEIGGGGAPMAGPVYHYNPDLSSERKWPAYFDGKALFGEWNSNKMFTMQLDSDGKLVDINQMLVGMGFKRPMDLTFGPDGAMYLVEWGSGFGGDNADSGIYRIDYLKGTRSPIARASATPISGHAPLTVQFSSDGTRDPDGGALTYAWEFGDGGQSTAANPEHTYTANGDYTAKLTVTNPNGKTAVANVKVTVGNTAPTVKINLPPNGGFFEFGDQVKYSLTVTDPEDGEIDCARVTVQSSLGHDAHAHPLDQQNGCAGTIQTLVDGGHGADANLFWVIEATYTDMGGPGVSALTGRDTVVLAPKRQQAEYFSATGRAADGKGGGTPGVQVENTGDTQGGYQNVGFIEDGDWFAFEPVNLTNVTSLNVRAAAASAQGGTVEARWGADNGPLLGSVAVPNTGGWQTYQDFALPLSTVPAETGTLYFVIRRPVGSSDGGGLLNVNWVDYVGRGVTDNQRPVVDVTATPTSGTAPLSVSFTTTATDPDGDVPLTYAWDFGVAGVPKPTTQNAAYTYTAPGTYKATVTVTDARGAATLKSVSIKVDPALSLCLAGRSDGFTGSELDRSRWTKVVRENQDLRVSDGKLIIPTSNTDIYGAAVNTTPNIVLQPLPSGPFTATAKLTLPARRAYQQAGLVIYGDDDNYAKMVLEGRNTSTDDANARIFQFIREENGQPNEVAASNTANLGASYPDTVYVRFTSDGSNLNAAYSADGVTFTAMAQTKSLAGMNNPHIGLISLSGTGSRPVLDAAFDWFHLTPDDTVTRPSPNDEFGGSQLDACRWDAVVRPNPSTHRVSGGNLEIDTENGDIYGSSNTSPKNFILQTAPDGDWTIETKVDGSALNERFQQAGLIVYQDDDNYVKFDYITDNQPGEAVARRIELRSEVGGVVQQPQPAANNLSAGVWWLRITRAGNTFRGYYSSNGTTWTELGTGVPNGALASAKVGLFAFGADQQASKTAKFDYFHLADRTPPTVTATLEPAVADGNSGWYVSSPMVKITAVDQKGGSGIDKVEYKLDDADWAVATDAVAIEADGEHTVQYRATDKAGNTSPVGTITVKRDATAPATTATHEAANNAGWHRGDIAVTLTATDTTSGVAATEYQLDSGAWTAYTGPVIVTGDGTHKLAYRSTDKAGNVEAAAAKTFKIDNTAPSVSVSGIANGQSYGDSGQPTVGWTATDAGSGVATTSATLDGTAIDVGTLSLWTLPLGEHTLVVTAVDSAGNRTTETVRFQVTTSYDDLKQHINRFRGGGTISKGIATALLSQLDEAKAEEAAGDTAEAKAVLQQFRSFATKQVADSATRKVLVRDAEALIDRLGN